MTVIGWQLVFFVLALEFIATFILLIPLPTALLPVRAIMIKSVIQVKRYLFVIAGICALLALQSFSQFNKYKPEPTTTTTIELLRQQQVSMFRNQRNFYMSATCFTLAIVLLRLAQIYQEQLDLHAKLKELKRVQGVSKQE